MTFYTIKKAAELQEREIQIILQYWEVAKWLEMTPKQFKAEFELSEFHLLQDEQAEILCMARINFDFKIKIQDKIYALAELVGLVSIVRRKGYGKTLIKHLVENVRNRDLEAIGLCEKENRLFYQSCEVPILPDKAKHLWEPEGSHWITSEDDDILIIHLSKSNAAALENLSAETPGYLIFS